MRLLLARHGETTWNAERRFQGRTDVALSPRGRAQADALGGAHGGVISVYACALLGCSFNALWRLRVDNASLTVVRPPRLVSLNDTAHLPRALAAATHVRASIAGGVAPSTGLACSPGRAP